MSENEGLISPEVAETFIEVAALCRIVHGHLQVMIEGCDVALKMFPDEGEEFERQIVQLKTECENVRDSMEKLLGSYAPPREPGKQ